ncbi:MAG: hypothetical protein ACAI43_14065 [Phycisphaerae bacterium]|nr:hypothetical protein [Tepidisphaeraceae bacterium]
MALFPQYRNDAYVGGNVQVRSAASIVAILCALASFYFSGQGRELPGFLLALVAIVAGMVGGVKALSPRVSGGMLSIAAVVLGVIAVLFAIVALIF